MYVSGWGYYYYNVDIQAVKRDYIFNKSLARSYISLFIVSLHLRNCTSYRFIHLFDETWCVLKAEGYADKNDNHRSQEREQIETG